MRFQSLLPAVALLTVSASACDNSPPPMEGAITLDVLLLTDPWAAPDTAYPFVADEDDALQFTIEATALDLGRQIDPNFTRELAIRVVPGEVLQPATVQMTGGRLESTAVQVIGSHGPTRIWLEDSLLTNRMGAETVAPTFLTGVTPEIHFSNPSTQDFQRSDGVSSSPLQGQHIQLLGTDQGRDLAVTHVTQDGFYFADLSGLETGANAEEFRNGFAFSFNRPDDLFEGDRLRWLSGNVEEFFWFTELSFPSWEPDLETEADWVPGPTELAGERICGSGAGMEELESSLVRASSAMTQFRGNPAYPDSDCGAFRQYGQWPVVLVDDSSSPIECSNGLNPRLLVMSAATVPGLNFESCLADIPENPPDQVFSFVQGMLRNHQVASPSWIMEVRDCDDLPEGPWSDSCGETPPASGARQAPPDEYRPLPYCVDPWVEHADRLVPGTVPHLHKQTP